MNQQLQLLELFCNSRRAMLRGQPAESGGSHNLRTTRTQQGKAPSNVNYYPRQYSMRNNGTYGSNARQTVCCLPVCCLLGALFFHSGLHT